MIQFCLPCMAQFIMCICKQPVIDEIKHYAAVKIQTAFREYRARLIREAIRTANIMEGIEEPRRRRSVIHRHRRRTTEVISSSSEEVDEDVKKK